MDTRKPVRHLVSGDQIVRPGEPVDRVHGVQVDETYGHVHVRTDRVRAVYGIADTEFVR